MAGCRSEPSEPASDGAGAGPTAMPTTTATTAPPVRTYAPTYTAIWDEILFPSCALAFCHVSDGALSLSTKDAGYGSLLSEEIGPACIALGLRHVEPFVPDQSLLYRKLTDAPCGELMPRTFGGPARLEARSVDQIREWIELGAKND